MRLAVAFFAVAVVHVHGQVGMPPVVPLPGQVATKPAITEPTDLLLAVGKAGPLQVGMPVDDVYRMFGSGVRLIAQFPEGMFQPALEIVVHGGQSQPSMVAEIDRSGGGKFALGRITVLDPRFRTTDGFGVGTTEVEVRKKFSFKISEEEGCHCAVIDALK